MHLVEETTSPPHSTFERPLSKPELIFMSQIHQGLQSVSSHIYSDLASSTGSSRDSITQFAFTDTWLSYVKHSKCRLEATWLSVPDKTMKILPLKIKHFSVSDWLKFIAVLPMGSQYSHRIDISENKSRRSSKESTTLFLQKHLSQKKFIYLQFVYFSLSSITLCKWWLLQKFLCNFKTK